MDRHTIVCRLLREGGSKQACVDTRTGHFTSFHWCCDAEQMTIRRVGVCVCVGVCLSCVCVCVCVCVCARVCVHVCVHNLSLLSLSIIIYKVIIYIVNPSSNEVKTRVPS